MCKNQPDQLPLIPLNPSHIFTFMKLPAAVWWEQVFNKEKDFIFYT